MVSTLPWTLVEGAVPHPHVEKKSIFLGTLREYLKKRFWRSFWLPTPLEDVPRRFLDYGNIFQGCPHLSVCEFARGGDVFIARTVCGSTIVVKKVREGRCGVHGVVGGRWTWPRTAVRSQFRGSWPESGSGGPVGDVHFEFSNGGSCRH